LIFGDQIALNGKAFLLGTHHQNTYVGSTVSIKALLFMVVVETFAQIAGLPNIKYLIITVLPFGITTTPRTSIATGRKPEPVEASPGDHRRFF